MSTATGLREDDPAAPDDQGGRADAEAAGTSEPPTGWAKSRRPPGTCESLVVPSAAVLSLAPHETQQLSQLYLRTQQVLWGSGLGYAKQMIEDCITGAIALASEPDAVKAAKQTQQFLADGVVTVTNYVDCAEGENARRRYSQGLLVGVAASIALLMLIAVATKWVIPHFMALVPGRHTSSIPLSNYFALRDVLVCVGGGAAGAAVSVLLRLSRETNLRYKTVANGAAMYRIVLGWFFAAALMFLVKGALTNLFTDPTADVFKGPGSTRDAAAVSSWFFWGGLGFLAGFNERWATHIISRDPAKPDDAAK